MVAGINIRTFCQADRQAVIGLWEAAFDDATPHGDPEGDIDRKYLMQPELFFVAAAGREIVGTVMAGDDGHRGWLYCVAVHPSRRRQGIGRALMQTAETALAARGCVKINLQVRDIAASVVPFYQSLGYSVEQRISMGKRLTN